jgi:hypothetical protein
MATKKFPTKAAFKAWLLRQRTFGVFQTGGSCKSNPTPCPIEAYTGLPTGAALSGGRPMPLWARAFVSAFDSLIPEWAGPVESKSVRAAIRSGQLLA